MKHILIAVTFVFIAAISVTTKSVANAAAPCKQLENQFFGTVRDVKHEKNRLGETICTYQVDVGGTPSGVCPLSDKQASALTLIDETCTLKNGDQTSGVIVTKTWIE